MKRFLGMAALSVLLVGLSLAAVRAMGDSMVGKPAPEIKAGGWINTKPLSLASLKGKVVVVEFWATWCPPCRASIPHLSAMFKTYSKSGVQFISLTDEDRAKVEPFVKEHEMPYPIGLSSQSGGAYGVSGIPHAVVIGRDGVVLWEGHPMDAKFEAAVKKAAAAK